MGKALFALIVFIFVLLLSVSVNALGNKETSKSCPKAGKAVKTMTMKNQSYNPETLTIQRCTKVVFKNQDNVSYWPASNLHPTHSIYPAFDPKKPIEPNQEWSFVFDKVGKWKYHDHLSPSIRGVIKVSD